MKTILTLILLFTFLYSNAQQPKQLSAGDYLIKAGRQKNTAVAIFLLGGVLAGVSAGASEQGAAPAMVGGISFLAAVIFEVSANGNIRKAGQRMNEKGIALSGAGLIYRF